VAHNYLGLSYWLSLVQVDRLLIDYGSPAHERARSYLLFCYLPIMHMHVCLLYVRLCTLPTTDELVSMSATLDGW